MKLKTHDTQYSMFDAFNNVKEFSYKKPQEGWAQLIRLYSNYWVLENSPRSALGTAGTHFRDTTIGGTLNDVTDVFLDPHVRNADEYHENGYKWENKTRYEWRFTLMPFATGRDYVPVSEEKDALISDFLQAYKSGTDLSQGDKDSNTITIYDWKEFRDFDADEDITWHIGSKGENHMSLCNTVIDLFYAGDVNRDVIVNHPFKAAEIEHHNNYGRTYFKIL